MRVQAHADALGTWGDMSPEGQRQWENDGRIDLRSVTNVARQLPYHVARHRGHRRVTKPQLVQTLQRNSDHTAVPSSAGCP